MSAPTLNLTVTKLNFTTLSPAETRAIYPENIKELRTLADNSVEVTYYDPTKVNLDSIVTTTSVNTIFAAMEAPLLIDMFTIGVSEINRAVVLNRNSMAMIAVTANPQTIEYNYGDMNHVNNKIISAFITPAAVSETITSASQANKTFRVATDLTTTFVPNLAFRVSGSTGGAATGNDKLYTVVSSAYTTYTTITVRETIPSAATDGTIIAA